jgi:WD40 repeat protein
MKDKNKTVTQPSDRLDSARRDRVMAQDLFLHGRRPEALAYLARATDEHPGSKLAAEMAVGMLNDWRYPVPSVICLGHKDRLKLVCFSTDSRWIVTASYDNTARVWDARTGKIMTILSVPNEGVDDAQFSPDGQWILIVSSDENLNHTVQIWDWRTGAHLTRLIGPKNFWGICFCPDGRRVLAYYENSLFIWDSQSGKLIKRLRNKEKVTGLNFGPDHSIPVARAWPPWPLTTLFGSGMSAVPNWE